jgi:hypothetical protein
VNNLPPDLSPEARRLIHAARGADDPTAEDQARVKARWLAGVAAVAGVSSLTEAARAAGGIGWGLKAVGAAVAVVAGAIGLYVALPEDPGARPGEAGPAWAGRTHERHEKAVSAPAEVAPAARELAAPQSAGQTNDPEATRPAIVRGNDSMATPALGAPEASTPAPSVAIPPVAAERASGEPAASPTLDVSADRPAADVSARTARERVAASRALSRSSTTRAVPVAGAPPVAPSEPVTAPEATPAAAASPSGQLGEELSLLSQVRSSVQDGTPQRALQLLADYEAKFGRPILEMEADALRVDALCGAGQREAARASAAAFQNEWPGSPLGRRVSAACP